MITDSLHVNWHYNSNETCNTKYSFITGLYVLLYCYGGSNISSNHEDDSMQEADTHSNDMQTRTQSLYWYAKYLNQTLHICSLRLPVIKVFCKMSERYFSAERSCQNADYNSICFGFKKRDLTSLGLNTVSAALSKKVRAEIHRAKKR